MGAKIEKMRLLIVDNHDSFTFNLVQLVEETMLCTFDVVPCDQVDIDKAVEYDKFLFSPGPGLPDEHPTMKQLIDRYKSTKSFLGICLGHQAISEYFGASLLNLKEVVHGQQKEITQVGSSILFKGLSQSFKVGLYHSWLVNPATVPSELLITAQTRDKRVMAISHREYDIHGIQFHPESILTPDGDRMIRNWLKR